MRLNPEGLCVRHSPDRACGRGCAAVAATTLAVLTLGGSPVRAQSEPAAMVRDETRLQAEPAGVRMVGPFYRLAPPPTSDTVSEPSPLSLTVRQGWRHHSNLYALSASVAQAQPGLSGADTVSVTGLRAAFDRRLGAQDLALWADLGASGYRRFDDLDHVAWNAGGLLNWQIGRQWYGTVSVGSERFLNPFSNQNRAIRNLLDLNALASSVGYRFGARWSAFAGADFVSRRNSSVDLRETDLDQTGLEAGFRLQGTNADSDVSLVARTVRGRFPNPQQFDAQGDPLAQPLDNGFRDRSALLRLSLRPSAPSRLVGEVGVTARRFDTLTVRNFSGLTGSFVWQWQPTDPLRAELYARRNLGPIQLGSPNYIDAVQTGGSLSWRVTSRLTLGATAGWDRYRYGGDPLSATGQTEERRDRVRTIGVSAAYEAWRRVTLIADHRREWRTSNYSAFSFDADITSLFVRARFD
jgi:hypothetical protein